MPDRVPAARAVGTEPSQGDMNSPDAVFLRRGEALARAAAAIDATLVHYGTDFVFDGTASEPYGEEDAPNPQSVYAASKLLGEWFAQGARHYVLRVESLFGGEAPAPGAGGRRPGGSLDRIAGALLEGREVRAFVGRVVSPSYVEDVAVATLALVRTAAWSVTS